MAKTPRTCRLPDRVDAALVEMADRRGEPIQRIMQEAIARYVGVPLRPGDIVPREDPKPPIVPLTSGNGGPEALTPVVQEAREVGDLVAARVGSMGKSGVRCTCPVPDGAITCLRCGKMR